MTKSITSYAFEVMAAIAARWSKHLIGFRRDRCKAVFLFYAGYFANVCVSWPSVSITAKIHDQVPICLQACPPHGCTRSDRPTSCLRLSSPDGTSVTGGSPSNDQCWQIHPTSFLPPRASRTLQLPSCIRCEHQACAYPFQFCKEINCCPLKRR